jgi:quercetin dioxygenase-like cupin family protein
MSERNIEAAEVVVACSELDATLRFFTEQLGFRVDVIAPADDPSSAVIAGHGLRIRLERGGRGAPGVLRLVCRDPAAVAGGATELTAPNGTRVELVAADPPLAVPPLRPSFVISRNDAEARWQVGRAGMRYRDLIPDRQGGRFIASHIEIADGGPVPDYVHFHKLRFQLIYCYRGWSRLVYEDQGPPFVLHPGDCVLQPPRIRHRVLESSAGHEVIEIACPAYHETVADHDLALPTQALRPDRDFGGQRFVRHVAADASFQREGGALVRDLGLAAATAGVVGARVLRRGATPPRRHDAELYLLFVLEGAAVLQCDRRSHRLTRGSAVVVPGGVDHALVEPSDDLELLEVVAPAGS